MEISELVLEPPCLGLPRRRRCPRYALRSLAYVKLDEANGGIIRDLGDSGMAIQAVARLRPDQVLRLQFDLLSPRIRIEARGRVCWADSSGQAGIEFCELPSKMQTALRDWMLTQMLATAVISGRDSMFSSFDPQLMLSNGARQAILLHSPKDRVPVSFLRWGRFGLSAGYFSFLVDTVVILCAVLLFSSAALITMGGLPAWPLTTGLFCSSSIIFIIAYQVIFSELLGGATLGKRLAIMAEQQRVDEPTQRFR